VQLSHCTGNRPAGARCRAHPRVYAEHVASRLTKRTQRDAESHVSKPRTHALEAPSWSTLVPSPSLGGVSKPAPQLRLRTEHCGRVLAQTAAEASHWSLQEACGAVGAEAVGNVAADTARGPRVGGSPPIAGQGACAAPLAAWLVGAPDNTQGRPPLFALWTLTSAPCPLQAADSAVVSRHAHVP